VPRQSLDPSDPVSIGAMVGPEAFMEVRYLAHAKQMQALERIPEYAAVTETVAAVKELKKPWAKGLVNAVLRNVQRQKSPSTASCFSTTADEAQYEHPQWLIDRLRNGWPERAEQLLQVNNTKAPMTLRINALQTTRDDYLAQLRDAAISAQPGALCEHAVILDTAVSVEQLPGFADGCASVQDEAAQLSSGLMKLSPGLAVLDACAAPGGKTCHLLESEPTLQVIAVDNSEQRCTLIRDNLQRLKLEAQTVIADATHPETWWKQQCDGHLFDRILVDAPCSATGVIRHHPDIKLLRKPTDIPALAATQVKLLQALWPLLEPGGYLLYVTCSILPQENDDVIASFLESVPEASIDAMDTAWGIRTRFGKQLLPALNGHDGFYFCRMTKSNV